MSVGTIPCYIQPNFFKLVHPPTSVGTTTWMTIRLLVLPVHPHMRGDNAIIFNLWKNGIGTPPHAWGQQSLRVKKGNKTRYTPTCVGTTRPRTLNPRGFSVYPHMRGDNIFFTMWLGGVIGTSPHAWGQLALPSLDNASIRYTPTCVGTTLFRYP